MSRVNTYDVGATGYTLISYAGDYTRPIRLEVCDTPQVTVNVDLTLADAIALRDALSSAIMHQAPKAAS